MPFPRQHQHSWQTGDDMNAYPLLSLTQTWLTTFQLSSDPCFFFSNEIENCTITSFETHPRLGPQSRESLTPQWCYDLSATVHIALNAVLEPACTGGDVRPLWDDVPAPEARSSSFVAFSFFSVDEVPVPVNILYIDFSKVLYFAPNSHFHTVWFYFVLSCGCRGFKANLSWDSPVCLLYMGFMWLLIVSGMWNYIFYFHFF